MNQPIMVTFPNSKIAQYVIDFLESDQHPVKWKDANLHNTALQSLLNGTSIPPQSATSLTE